MTLAFPDDGTVSARFEHTRSSSWKVEPAQAFKRQPPYQDQSQWFEREGPWLSGEILLIVLKVFWSQWSFTYRVLH